MKITWYGHAAFRVETQGVRLILDPYRSPDSGGYAPIDDTADVVVVSHENDRYHSHLGQIRPPFEVVRALELPPEGREVAGIRLHAIPVFETPERKPGDEVTIIHFYAEGLHLVFLGDLGHPLEDHELEPIRGADILMIPAGGPPTIDYASITGLIDAIAPRVVLPMHYKTVGINLAIEPVERFLEALPSWPVERPGSASLMLERGKLPARPTIVILRHDR